MTRCTPRAVSELTTWSTSDWNVFGSSLYPSWTITMFGYCSGVSAPMTDSASGLPEAAATHVGPTMQRLVSAW